MRDYWLTKDLLQAAGIGFILLSLVGIGLALWLPKKWWGKLLALMVVGVLIAIPVRKAGKEMKAEAQEQQAQANDYKERYATAKALFDERCKTAGEKVYRTVEGVEGVLLLNVRGTNIAEQRNNPRWPDAGLPDESGGDQYIKTFLYWEQRVTSPKPDYRGYVNNLPSDTSGHQTFRGYSFVDVKGNDGLIQRYRLTGPHSSELSREKISTQPARYAVSFVNMNEAAERRLWVAGTTVTITDTKTNEVLATSTWYAFEPGLGSEAGGRQPWGFATICPKSGSGNSPTRFFVDQILKPNKGE